MNIGTILRENLSAINKLHLFILTIFYLCSCHSIKEQHDVFGKYDSLTEQNVYIAVEKMPIYRGGNIGFLNDFGKYFHYDYSQYLEENIQTKLCFQFIIDIKGHLCGERIYGKNTDELTDFEKAGLKALNLMQNWQTGVHKNKAVNVLLTKTIHVDFNKMQ
jgi:hypothetical protein